jgi:hypothetical protein
MRKIKSCVSVLVAGSAVCVGASLPALAASYRYFENPNINGYWVDGCIVEFGEVNCSDWGQTVAANAFCNQMGWGQVYGTWYTRHELGTDHTTYRYTQFRRDGRETAEWRACVGCEYRITRIECRRD